MNINQINIEIIFGTVSVLFLASYLVKVKAKTTNFINDILIISVIIALSYSALLLGPKFEYSLWTFIFHDEYYQQKFIFSDNIFAIFDYWFPIFPSIALTISINYYNNNRLYAATLTVTSLIVLDVAIALSRTNPPANPLLFGLLCDIAGGTMLAIISSYFAEFFQTILNRKTLRGLSIPLNILIIVTFIIGITIVSGYYIFIYKIPQRLVFETTKWSSFGFKTKAHENNYAQNKLSLNMKNIWFISPEHWSFRISNIKDNPNATLIVGIPASGIFNEGIDAAEKWQFIKSFKLFPKPLIIIGNYSVINISAVRPNALPNAIEYTNELSKVVVGLSPSTSYIFSKNSTQYFDNFKLNIGFELPNLTECVWFLAKNKDTELRIHKTKFLQVTIESLNPIKLCIPRNDSPFGIFNTVNLFENSYYIIDSIKSSKGDKDTQTHYIYLIISSPSQEVMADFLINNFGSAIRFDELVNFDSPPVEVSDFWAKFIEGKVTTDNKTYNLSGDSFLGAPGDNVNVALAHPLNITSKGLLNKVTINGVSLSNTLWSSFSTEVKNGFFNALFILPITIIGALAIDYFRRRGKRSSEFN
jgi:hypothetical protein